MPERRALRGWKLIRLSGVSAEVFLLGRLTPCESAVRHYVAVDILGDLHCLEYINGCLMVCIDELTFYWDQGAA